MLITSRNTKRWVFPKGHVEKNLTPYNSAAKEAFEEAGVKGNVSSKRLGSYRYIKPEIKGVNICKVDVYPMAVSKELSNWPEKDQRDRQWTPIEDAANMIAEKKLGKILRKFSNQLNTTAL
ncbi:NUDIX hydrolase [Terasakiella sp. A23]|uniref:NUDIX hydrolase n=1 Tax=Terasakiella sp. FCG-A23 TaxID=3080561 RepID=UPI003986A628